MQEITGFVKPLQFGFIPPRRIYCIPTRYITLWCGSQDVEENTLIVNKYVTNILVWCNWLTGHLSWDPKQPLEHLSMQAVLHMMEKMERINDCTLQWPCFRRQKGRFQRYNRQASLFFHKIIFGRFLLILVLLGSLHFILSAQPHWGPEGQPNTIFSHEVTPRTAPRAFQTLGFSIYKYISVFCKMKIDLCVRPPEIKEWILALFPFLVSKANEKRYFRLKKTTWNSRWKLLWTGVALPLACESRAHTPPGHLVLFVCLHRIVTCVVKGLLLACFCWFTSVSQKGA